MSGEGYANDVNVAFAAFTALGAGFANGYEAFSIKVRNTPNGRLEVKLFGGGTGQDSVANIELASYVGATNLGNGWYEVVIPFAEFTNPNKVASHSGYLIGMPNDNGADQFTFYFTDIELLLEVPPIFSALDFSGSGYLFSGFDGASASVIADPTVGAAEGNKVVSYTELASAKHYAGASLGLDSAYSVDPIPFDVAAGETVITARVYVDSLYGVGKVVRMQVADTAGTNDANYVEAQATTTQAGWNTLVFDFSQPVSRYVAAQGGNATTQLASGVTYDKISLFIDWDNGYAWDGAGVGTPPTQDRTYYIDDVTFVGFTVLG